MAVECETWIVRSILDTSTWTSLTHRSFTCRNTINCPKRSKWEITEIHWGLVIGPSPRPDNETPVYLKYSQNRLQYNDHGYIELTAIKNQRCFHLWPRAKWSLYYINVHFYNELTVIANKYGRSRDGRYNRVRLVYVIMITSWFN